MIKGENWFCCVPNVFVLFGVCGIYCVTCKEHQRMEGGCVCEEAVQ